MKVQQHLGLCHFALLGAMALVVFAGCKSGNGATDERSVDTSVPSDPIIDVPNQDAEMDKAIKAAQASVGVFVAELAKGDTRMYSVKKPFSFGVNQAEHMWLRNVSYADGMFTGILDNQPRDAKVEIGKKYQVGRAEISDWMISDANGRIHGSYTTRVLLPQMPPAQRAAMKKAFMPLPASK